MFLAELDQTLMRMGTTMEWGCREMKNFPHVRYVVRPFYRALAKKVGDVAATALTFMAADVVIHQLVGHPINCGLAHLLAPTFPVEIQEKIVVETCTFSYDYLQTFFWTAVALPIMYVKYRRKQGGGVPLHPL